MAHDPASLVTALRTGDAAAQQAAAEQLAQLGEDAQAAAVPLVEACAASDALREWVVAALESLGAPAAVDVPALAKLVHRPQLDVAYWAATLLGRLEAEAAPAVSDLTAALGDHAELAVRQRAAWALGKIGAAAAPARDALRDAAAGADARLAALAKEAMANLSA
jgi:hypothetical protein